MHIREAQKVVMDHIRKIGYTEIETEPYQAFLHLIEEVGETARTILHQVTKRGEKIHSRAPSESLEEEVADIFWQTLKLAGYLDMNLETAFQEKYKKNLAKPKLPRK